jgi:hypothetical protein
VRPVASRTLKVTAVPGQLSDGLAVAAAEEQKPQTPSFTLRPRRERWQWPRSSEEKAKETATALAPWVEMGSLAFVWPKPSRSDLPSPHSWGTWAPAC